MAVSLGPGDGEDGDDAPVSAINTTPLVDVMLVLLIIFLITVPVVTGTLPVALPKQTLRSAPPDPATVTLTIDRDGLLFWNDDAFGGDEAALAERLRALAARTPRPPLHIRGDATVRYGLVSRLVAACHRAGIDRIGFVTERTPNDAKGR